MKLSGAISRKKAFIILLIFQCAVLGFILAFCSIKYEVSDDFVIELMLSGGFSGKPDWHLLFSNPLLGMLLYPFYLIAPSVSWYFIFQLAVCFSSFLSLSWVLSDKNNKLIGIGVAIIITMASAGDLYVLPQFTKTAAAAVVSGSLLFLYGRFVRDKVIPTILGVLLVIAGTFLRFVVIYAVGLFILLALIIYAVRYFREDKNRLGWLLKKVLPSLLLIALVFGLNSIGARLFLTGDGYDHYRAYNTARSSIVDYSYYDYSEYEDELSELGISENDYILLRNWNFGDSEKFDLDNMKKISGVLNANRKKGELKPGSFIQHLRERKFHTYFLIWWIIVLGIICIIGNWRKLWIPVLCALMVLFYVVMFYYMGRKVYRVEFGFLFAAGAVIAWAADRTNHTAKETARNVIYCALAGIAIGTALAVWIPNPAGDSGGASCRENIEKYLYKSWNYRIEKYSVYMDYGNVYGDFIQLARDNPQNVYMLEFNTTIQTLYYDFSPFESGASVMPDNLFWISGVISEYPSTNRWLEERGFTGGTFKALLEDNVYYVGNRWSKDILTYLHENGYPDASVGLVDTVDDYSIYKFNK